MNPKERKFLNSKRIKIIFKIALPELSVHSSKKNCDALGEFILSFRQAFTECLLYSKPAGSTGGPQISEIQSCNQIAAS